jgi:hypothetical protein
MTHSVLPNELVALLNGPLSVARGAASGGQRVVGYVGNDVPIALILAAGALPVRLRARARIPTPLADAIVESAFAVEHRILVEQWLRGDLDFLESVVFPRSDDSAQRVYYYICELQRRGQCAGPRALLFDVAGITRDSSRDYTLESTRRLAQELGARDDSLPAAIKRVAIRADWLHMVRAQRTLPSPLAGSTAAALEFASHQDWRPDFESRAAGWLHAAPPLPLPRRLLLAGDAPCGTELQLTAEVVGASVVLELTEAPLAELPIDGDPMAAIATNYQQRSAPVAAMRRDGAWVAKHAAKIRANGVVLWLTEENEALPWEVARQVHALQTAKMPTLVLARQNWEASADSLSQLMHFIRELGGRPS